MTLRRLTLLAMCLLVATVCGCNKGQAQKDDRIFDDQAIEFFEAECERFELLMTATARNVADPLFCTAAMRLPRFRWNRRCVQSWRRIVDSSTQNAM